MAWTRRTQLPEMLKREPRPCFRCDETRFVGMSGWCSDCIDVIERRGALRRASFADWLSSKISEVEFVTC